MTSIVHGLSLAPFRAARYSDATTLGDQLSPPYDVISDAERAELVQRSDTNVVRLILPSAPEADLAGGDPYGGANTLLNEWVRSGVIRVDDRAALYVYQMTTPEGDLTRGLLGAVELRDPDDHVILPHENTMAGPVADRLALMSSTEANLEPIYLVYDGGGAASELVASVDHVEPTVRTTTPDGVQHLLWAVTDANVHEAVEADLRTRRALIADGHHRYATYRQLQADHQGEPGPWDRGLTFLVDTSRYGPQVHPIHRVVARPVGELLEAVRSVATLSEPIELAEVENSLAAIDDFAVALVDGDQAVIVSEVAPADDSALGRLDVSILHKVLVERVWGLEDTVDNVGYAHDVSDAVAAARASGGTAVLLRATPVASVAAVAAAGGRMPRKSTLFTPKPASGLVIRRFVDQ